MQTRIERTGAGSNYSASKAAALAEIDGPSDPRFWFSTSEGVVYFSIPGGCDATASTFFASINSVPTKNRPAYFATYSGGGRLALVDIDGRYVNFNFLGSQLSAFGCYVHGAPLNCWDVTGKAFTIGCEASGAGSGVTESGDGFNNHYEGDWEHRFCWSPDNREDGWSSHENIREAVSALLLKQLGVQTHSAYSCNALYINPLTVENALQSVRLRTGKLGGI